MDIVFLIAVIQAVLASSWRLATPIIYASIGEVFTERSGVLNIGLEGIMLMGAFAGFAGTFYTGSLILGLLIAMFSGILSGLLFAIFTVTIKANQIVVGAALNLIGLGLTGFLYRTLFAGQSQGIEAFAPLEIPFLSDIPLVGEILFGHNILVYGTVVLVLVASFVMS